MGDYKRSFRKIYNRGDLMFILNSLEDLDSVSITSESKLIVFNPAYAYNRKNKTKYTVLSKNVISSTSKYDGYKYCLYTDGKEFYVRELEEFKEKFSEKPIEKEESDIDNGSSKE
jgi:hypothetical protein